MPETENKAFVRRWFDEVWNLGRSDRIDEMSAPDTAATGLGPSKSQGLAAFKTFYTNMRQTFPDLHVTICLRTLGRNAFCESRESGSVTWSGCAGAASGERASAKRDGK